MGSKKQPHLYNAHFPRTYYDVIVAKRPSLLAHLRSDIEEMARRGFEGAADGPVLDDYPGLQNHFTEVLTGVRRRMDERHLAMIGRPVTDEEFANALAIDEATGRLKIGTLGEYLSTLNFEKAGKKVFSFSDQLIARLADTALDAPAEYLRLPFFSCMFFIRSRVAIDALYRIGGRPPPSSAPLSIFLCELPFHGMRKIMIQVFHGDDGALHNFVKRELLINPKWTIERSLRTDWTNLNVQHPDWNAGDGPSIGDVIGHTEDEAVFYEDGLHFFRIVVNAILYLASTDPDLSLRASPVAAMQAQAKATLNGYKRHALEQELERYSKLDGAVVGENLPPIIAGRPHSHGPSGSPGLDAHYDRRFLVRGHWRNQAHGEEMKLRKLIWIQPYWKGPEMAEMVNKPYEVR